MSEQSDPFIPTVGTISDNRADEIEGIIRPSMGQGLVAPENGGYNTSIAQDYMDAIKAVVHPDTLKEWSDARLPYRLTPEDQQGINYMLQTKDSKWRRISVLKMTREMRDGEEVLVADVLEQGENLVHETVEWSHVIGLRFKSDFEHSYNGLRVVAGRPKNTRPLFLIPWDKRAAGEILSTHNNKKTPTKFYLDVGYTKFGSITQDDFMNLSYADLHDKYLRGVTFGETAASQKFHKKLQNSKSITLLQEASTEDRDPTTYPALNSVTPQQIAQLFDSGEAGKQMAMSILRQLPPGQAAAIAFGATDALKAIELKKQIGPQKVDTPDGQAVEFTVPMSGGTAGRVDVTPTTAAGGGMQNDKMPWTETSSFTRVEHDEQGNPTRKILTDRNGKDTYIDLTPEQAAEIKAEEDRLTKEFYERQDKEQKELAKHRQEKNITTKPEANEGPAIEEILAEEDDEGRTSPLKPGAKKLKKGGSGKKTDEKDEEEDNDEQ